LSHEFSELQEKAILAPQFFVIEHVLLAVDPPAA